MNRNRCRYEDRPAENEVRHGRSAVRVGANVMAAAAISLALLAWLDPAAAQRRVPARPARPGAPAGAEAAGQDPAAKPPAKADILPAKDGKADVLAPKSEPQEKVRHFPAPARKMDAWGRVAQTTVKLLDGLAGANSLSVSSALGGEQAAAVQVAQDRKDAVSLSCKHAQKGPVAVALLEIKDGSLQLTWNAITPAGLDFKAVDGYVKAAMIQVSRDDTVLAKAQCAPVELELRMNQLARLDSLDPLTKLQAGELGEPWKSEELAPDKLRLFTEGAGVLVILDAKMKTVRAQWEPPDKSKIKDLEDEILSVRRDAVRLVERKRAITSGRTTPRPGMVDDTSLYSEKVLNEQIESSKKRLEELDQEIKKLKGQDKALRTLDVSKCEARIAYDNGVAVYRIKLKR